MDIFCKYPEFVGQSDDAKFDALHEPGIEAPFSGIYRCQACGKAATSIQGNRLPPQNHHEHPGGQGAIRWRLAVWG